MRLYTFIDSSEDLNSKIDLTLYPTKSEVLAEMKEYMSDGSEATLVVLEVVSITPYEHVIRAKPPRA